MRYATDTKSVSTDSDSKTGSTPPLEHSLAKIIPSARFFAADDILFSGVAANSGSVTAGELVVYRIGETCPEQLISEAMARGAAGILTEQLLPSPLPQCIVGDAEFAMATIIAEANGRPDRQMLTIGVTGSAGKTTTTLLLSSLLRSRGVRTAYQTDLGDCDGVVQGTSAESIPSGSELVQWLADVNDANCEANVIELSSDQLRHGQYDAIEFDVLVVTGCDSPNQDFGPSSLHCAIDRLATNGVVIAPADDGKVMGVLQESDVAMVTYGVRNAADVSAKIIDQSGGMTTLMISHEDTSAMMETSLCGAAMAANHAASIMAGLMMKMELHEIVETLSRLREVPGRGQRLESYEHATVIIDQGGDTGRAAGALRTARSLKANGQLWCVLAVDCEDDPNSLAEYGKLLERFANQTIVCSSTGNEGFLKASHCVLDGVERCSAMRLVSDRRRAISWAVGHAKANDTVLILGGPQTKSAHQQRSEIKKVVQLVEMERQELSEDVLTETIPKAPDGLKIYRAD